MATALFDVDATLGALSVGFGVSCALFGILTTQIFTYFKRYSSDTTFYKLLVGAIWLVSIIDQIFIGHCTYYYTIMTYADPIVLIKAKPVWSLIVQQTLGTLVGTIVKAVFTIRVWKFSNRSIPVTGFIASVILLQFVCGMIYTAKAFQQTTLLTSLPKLKTIATLALSAGAASDVFTAIALTYYLSKLRTGYQNSDTLINSLIRYGMSTGSLSSALSLITLILYNIHPSTFQFIAVFFVLSKILAISLLTSLNTRKSSSAGAPNEYAGDNGEWNFGNRVSVGRMSSTLKLGSVGTNSHLGNGAVGAGAV